MFVPDPMNMLSDGLGPVKSVQNYMQRIGKGARFLRSPTINDAYWSLIEKCWKKLPNERPSFQEIVNALTGNVPQFLFPGAIEAVVRQYVSSMGAHR
jgi:hypothetical protein